MKVILYPRVSTTKQSKEGDSVEFQEKRLKEHSQNNNDEVVGVYTDSGISASISDDKMDISYRDGKIYVVMDVSKRIGMVKILDELKSNKWDGIKITKWDRFSRNNIFSKIVQLYFKKFKKEIIPTDDSIDPLMIEIKGALSEEEIRKMKGRVRDVRRYRFEKGLFSARSPFGYKPLIKDKKIVGFVIDNKKAEIVSDCFKMASEGHSYKDICKKHKLKPQQYYNIIKNKVYCGYISFEGEERVGNHKPIISEELFFKCQK